jgi:hypothetical protein
MAASAASHMIVAYSAAFARGKPAPWLRHGPRCAAFRSAVARFFGKAAAAGCNRAAIGRFQKFTI